MSSINTRAMILSRQGENLRAAKVELPEPQANELLVEIAACGVCRTDLHVIDGDLKEPRLPLIPGHEIVGRIAACGANVSEFRVGDRVAVPWLASCCLNCSFCLSGRENLCDSLQFTGYTRDGGYADYTISDARFSYKLQQDYSGYSDGQIAPLLCAGLIGWRSFKFAAGNDYMANGRKLGIYGFGAAGHIILQVCNYFGWQTYVFTRQNDKSRQEFAIRLGAKWAGSSTTVTDEKLDAAIIYAPAGFLLPQALRNLDKGGIVVCAGIHMSEIPAFSYDLLWGERRICSVANLTRKDAQEFLTLAPKIKVRAEITEYPLSQANEAIDDLRSGRLIGAAVLLPGRTQQNDP